jgi:hypothetical protein
VPGHNHAAACPISTRSVERENRMRTSPSTSRGRPPRGFCLAGGILGATMAHCSSVGSKDILFENAFLSHMRALLC